MKTQQSNMMLREGETQTRDLKMRPGAKVSGVVKGTDGPLSGAKVTVSFIVATPPSLMMRVLSDTGASGPAAP